MSSEKNNKSKTLEEQYEEAWSTLTTGRPSLSDLSRFGNVAREYATTAEGERRIYSDLAKSEGAICAVLEEALAERASQGSGKDHRTPQGYSLSKHVIQQAEAKGFTLEQLIQAVDAPQTAYESRRYPGQMKHIRDGLCVAVDVAAKKAITVFVDHDFTELRPDQTDADALAYGRKRAGSAAKESTSKQTK